MLYFNFQNMEVDDLFAQCNSYQEATERPGVYTEKFIFLSADKISGPEESELYGKVSIVQENRTETVIDFTISKQKVCPIRQISVIFLSVILLGGKMTVLV